MSTTSILDDFDNLSREDRTGVYVQSLISKEQKLMFSRLNQITSRLSRYEWRDLQNALGQRRFQRDMIGDSEMPLEIVILIFEHLPLNAAFVYQRVFLLLYLHKLYKHVADQAHRSAKHGDTS
jgi:hypothetical protein